MHNAKKFPQNFSIKRYDKIQIKFFKCQEFLQYEFLNIVLPNQNSSHLLDVVVDGADWNSVIKTFDYENVLKGFMVGYVLS